MPASEVPEKWKSGQLHSGGPNGPVVPHTKKGQKKMVAIMMSEKRAEEETGSPDRHRPKRKKEE